MSIGTVLKEAREKKDFSLEDVHAKIKIHPRVLQLLEEEKFDKLPSPLFAKSFLKSYAQFLEVNAEELVGDYEKEKKTVEPEQQLYLKPADMGTARGLLALRPWAVPAAVVLLLVVAILGPARFLGGMASKTKTDRPRAAVKTIKIPPLKKPETAPTAEGWLMSVQNGNFPKLNKREPLELAIKALDSVWVHVTSDGKVLFQGVMKKNAVENWKAKDTIEIWTGNASNMSLSIKGRSLGSPGKGVVKRMVVSHEGIRIASGADA